MSPYSLWRILHSSLSCFHIYPLILWCGWIHLIHSTQYRTILQSHNNQHEKCRKKFWYWVLSHIWLHTRPQTLKHSCLWKESLPLTKSNVRHFFLTFWAFSFKRICVYYYCYIKFSHIDIKITVYQLHSVYISLFYNNKKIITIYEREIPNKV